MVSVHQASEEEGFVVAKLAITFLGLAGSTLGSGIGSGWREH